jgi:chromate transporter
MNEKQKLKEVAAFFKIRNYRFWGPAAHISMMREEVVVKKKWGTTLLRFNRTTNLIPGPNSTEMAIHIGHEEQGGRTNCRASVS